MKQQKKSEEHSAQAPKAGKNRRKSLLIILAILLVLAAVLFAGGYWYIKSLLGNVERHPLDESDLGISSAEPEESSVEESVSEPEAEAPDVTNVLLFGVDGRDVSQTIGRSDSIIVLSLDKTHNKIKLSSIARDTYAEVEGYGKTKINNAFSYGGPQLAVKTINQNFNLDAKDFVAVNFLQLSEIIDYIGGVTINVDEDEREVMEGYIQELNRLGIETEPVTETGDLLLSGGQAVAYARNRYTGNDLNRMERQREVLYAMVQAVLDMDIQKYPELISMILSQCVTSLTDEEMIAMGSWALLSKPSFEQYALPNDDCNAHGETINEQWHFVYDLDNAAQLLHGFIYEDAE